MRILLGLFALLLSGLASAQDSFEADNDAASAKNLVVNAGPQNRTIHQVSDVDFMRLDVLQGQSASIILQSEAPTANDAWRVDVYRGTVTTSNRVASRTFGRNPTSIPVASAAGSTTYYIRVASVPTFFTPAFYRTRATSATSTNQPPTVQFNAPRNGDLVALGAAVGVSASATDADGGVIGITFLVNGNIEDSVSGGNFSRSWTPQTAGSYVLTAVATDSAGATGSASITVSVTPGATSQLRLDSGTAIGPDLYSIELIGAGFAADAYVDVRASTSSNVIAVYSGTSLVRDGSTRLVAMIADPNLQSLLNTSGLYFWVVNPGSGFAGPVHVLRTPPQQVLPVVTAGSSIGQDGYTIQLTGTGFASNSYIDVRGAESGPIIAVFQASELTRGTNNGQQSLTFYVPETPVQLRSILSSTGLYFWVVNPSPPANWTAFGTRVVRNAPPSVQFLQPAPGQQLPIGVQSAIRVETSDTDGQVQRVEYSIAGSFLTSSSTAPFTVQWTPIVGGMQSIVARAIDDKGGVGTATISVSVVGGTAPVLTDVRVTDPDEYRVRLSGTNFPTVATIDVREGSSGPVIARYSGNQLTTGTSGGMSTIEFSLLSANERARLDGAGLYFWVVDANAGVWSDGRLGVKTVLARGGSNFNVYALDYQSCPPNGRECYGLIANYHRFDSKSERSVRSIVQGQLQSMFSNGQRRLRIGIYFTSRPADHRLVIRVPDPAASATYPMLGAQHAANLEALLRDIHAAGFKQVIIGLFPMLESSPLCFGSTQVFGTPCANADGTPEQVALMTQQYQQIIRDTRSIAASVRAQLGLSYLLDLGNELIPDPSRPVQHYDFLRNLWSWYVQSFGTSDSVGFSIALDGVWAAQNRVSEIGAIFGANTPRALQLHIYGDHHPATGWPTNEREDEIFSAAHQILTRQSLSAFSALPWIIGETWYGDTLSAERHDAAIRTTGRKIWFLLQWPRYRNDVPGMGHPACNIPPGGSQSDCSAPPPYDFSRYLELGF